MNDSGIIMTLIKKLTFGDNAIRVVPIHEDTKAFDWIHNYYVRIVLHIRFKKSENFYSLRDGVEKILFLNYRHNIWKQKVCSTGKNIPPHLQALLSQ